MNIKDLSYEYSKKDGMNVHLVTFYDKSGNFLFKSNVLKDLSKMSREEQEKYLMFRFADTFSKM